MPSEPAIFPELTLKNILDCQFSSWYPKFSSVSIKSTIVRPLPADFFDYLQSDGVFAPVGSDPQYVFYQHPFDPYPVEIVKRVQTALTSLVRWRTPIQKVQEQARL